MSTIVTGYASVEVCFKHQVPDGHCTAIVIDGAYTDTFHIRKESFGQVVSVIPGADRRFCENQVLLRSSLVDVEQFAAITSIVMVGCSCYILSGFGIDRMVMMMTNSPAIRDVLLFPTMKPLNDVNKGNDVKNQPAEEMKAEPEKIDFSKVKIEPLFEEAVDFDTFSKSDFRAVKVKECVAVPKSKKLLQFTLDDGTGTDRTILSGIHAYYEPEELVGKTLIAITNLPPRAMMGIDSCGMLLSAIHEEEGEEKLHLLMVDDHIPAGAKLY